MDEQCKVDIAYLAGIIASDGYVREREVRIATSSRDYAMKLCNMIESLIGVKCRISTWKNCVVLRIYSKTLVNKITEILKIKPGKKAEHLVFPRNLSNKEKQAFIAGFFDGDGSIRFIKSGLKNGRWGPYKTCRIVFSSKSRRFIEELAQELINMGFLNPRLSFDSGVYRLKLYGQYNLCLFIKLILPYMKHPNKLRDTTAWANSCREMSG